MQHAACEAHLLFKQIGMFLIRVRILNTFQVSIIVFHKNIIPLSTWRVVLLHCILYIVYIIVMLHCIEGGVRIDSWGYCVFLNKYFLLGKRNSVFVYEICFFLCTIMLFQTPQDTLNISCWNVKLRMIRWWRWRKLKSYHKPVAKRKVESICCLQTV